MPSSGSSRPTLRDIAREAGLSLAAASLALRNNPRISAATRLKVQQIAKRLDYHPDPKIATLMQHLRAQGASEYRETLAYLSSYPSYDAWNWMPHHDYYLGAAERALELGYRLDLFHLSAPDMTPARMSRLLVSRGIRGLLVGGFDKLGVSLDLDWKNFAAVAFDYSLQSPLLHRAANNHYNEMLALLERLSRAGCQRIALNANSGDDAKVLGLWHSAYLRHQEYLPKSRRLPVNFSPDGRGNLAAWMEKVRPDAVVSAGFGDFCVDYEKVTGRQPPSDIRYANLNIAYTDGRANGIDKLTPIIGRLACEHLVAQLQRNEIGLPSHPQIISIEGQWVEDFTEWKREREDWRERVRRKIS
ncbi:LacI family transcriptional regulator [Terrimicrobium sacchariphilum]|uniref:LacI family transcriptional regulator n=1 Tax=Terrimicrobium sacchariphilum TaxID=690879 RepID=A0A146G7W5_TERSA|nr:LacI family transcriptional regulator [Terrimicrobium sacchariphilum]